VKRKFLIFAGLFISGINPLWATSSQKITSNTRIIGELNNNQSQKKQGILYELNSPDDLSRAKSLFRWSILYMFGICLLLLISRTQLSVEFEQQSMQIFFSLVSLISN